MIRRRIRQLNDRIHVQLGERDVHVWSVRTEAANSVIATLESLLSVDEKARAARFHFDHLHRAYVIRHGALRILLGNYLGIPAEAVQFEYGEKGKPSVHPSAGVDFNASRTEGLGVFAFTKNLEIGIDVEHIRPIPEIYDIADRFFCREEAAELRSLHAPLHELAFHLCWTRKEAYLKAIGEGLSAPLDQFRVTLRPGEPSRFLEFMQEPELATEWVLRDLQLMPGYAAALAYRDRERPLTVFPVLDPAELLS